MRHGSLHLAQLVSSSVSSSDYPRVFFIFILRHWKLLFFFLHMITKKPLDPSIDLHLTALRLLCKGWLKHSENLVIRLWSLPIGVTVSPEDSSTAYIHTSWSRTQPEVPTGKTSILPTSPGFYEEPTASSYDPGLSHPRALGVRIITNAELSLKCLCIWFGSNWCEVRIGVDECVCRSEFNSQRYIAQKWTEGPTELIKEVVLNPQPDLEGVPVEVEKMKRQWCSMRTGRRRLDERLSWEKMQLFLEIQTSSGQWSE